MSRDKREESAAPSGIGVEGGRSGRLAASSNQAGASASGAAFWPLSGGNRPSGAISQVYLLPFG